MADKQDRIEKQLTSVDVLQLMMRNNIEQPGHVSYCSYIGAIAYRLAEARDLGIKQEEAERLASDQSLAGEKGKPKPFMVKTMAKFIYAQDVPPQMTFNNEYRRCKEVS